MSNGDWCLLFSEVNVKCLTLTTLDHYPILLCWEASSRQHKPRNEFKLKNAWLTEPMFNDLVIEKWHKYENDNIMGILEKCSEHMMKWSKDKCHKIRKQIERLLGRLKEFDNMLVKAILIILQLS